MMAESKIKEVAKLLGVEMGVPFNVKKENGRKLEWSPYTLKKDGLHDKDNHYGDVVLTYLLNGTYKIEKTILDDVEKRYLESVLRPFKDKVVFVKKSENVTGRYVYVCLKNDSFAFPYLKNNKMYKGMILHKQYTLEELGLFQNKESEK